MLIDIYGGCALQIDPLTILIMSVIHCKIALGGCDLIINNFMFVPF